MRFLDRLTKHFWISIIGIIGITAMVIVAIVRFPLIGAHASAGDMTTLSGNDARTGYYQNETAINASNAANLELHWIVRAGGHMTDQVLVANGKLYWGSWDG